MLDAGRFTVGSTPESDLVVGDIEGSNVSKHHAVITIIPAEVVESSIGTVRDLGSADGTYLNGLRISKTITRIINQRKRKVAKVALDVPLFEGDSLVLGKAGYGIRIIQPNATMTNRHFEIEERDGNFYLRGRSVDLNEFGAPEKRLLSEFFSSLDGRLTFEEIYKACHERNKAPGPPNRYSQQLITKLRSILKEHERYRGFLFENNHGAGYTLRRPEV
jgi:hypothetical protein